MLGTSILRLLSRSCSPASALSRSSMLFPATSSKRRSYAGLRQTRSVIIFIALICPQLEHSSQALIASDDIAHADLISWFTPPASSRSVSIFTAVDHDDIRPPNISVDIGSCISLSSVCWLMTSGGFSHSVI